MKGPALLRTHFTVAFRVVPLRRWRIEYHVLKLSPIDPAALHPVCDLHRFLEIFSPEPVVFTG